MNHSPQKKAVSITLHGRVQGVGFRYFVFSLAQELGVKGFVRNIPDRKVYIEAEADPELLEVFVHHCKQGPSHASVTSTNVIEIPLQGFDGFVIG